jgi:hypothetical protein
MRFALICDVESSIQLADEVVVKLGDREYSFIPDATNTLHRIKVTADVARPEYFTFSSLQHPTLGATIAIGSDGQLYEALTHELQELESLLAFSYNLNRIHWEHAREERIAERPEERGFGFQLVPEYKEARIPITRGELTSLLNNKKLLSPLAVVKSFWREARNSYNASRYISAFVNSFFILEGLYANGKFGKKEICRQFLACPPFVDSITRLFAMVQQECPEHLHKLSKGLEQSGKTLDVKEFAELLVATRADLSHFVSRDLRKRARLSEESYWSISFLCLKLATILIEHQSDLLVQGEQNDTTT